MISLSNIGVMKKCNLWMNEHPNIECECLEELRETIIKNDWTEWEDLSCAIEVSLKQRHSSNYALLGMSYTHDNTDKLVIKVSAGEENGPIIENTLVSEVDEVHAGIPLEYAESVIKLAESYLNDVSCSSGTITFDIGGHGYIGSSSAIFRKVTEILLKILCSDGNKEVKTIEKIVCDCLRQ